MARLQVLLAALCFGTTGAAQALGPDGIDPAAVGAARIACGGALVVLVALLMRRAGIRRRWARGPVLAGAAGVAVYQVSFFAAVADTGVAAGTVVALGSAPTLAGAPPHGRRRDRHGAGALRPAAVGRAARAPRAAAGDGMIARMSSPRALIRPSTVDLLAAELRREILDGALPAGARLRERELCERYEVARHSLRAALRTLAAEGLVRIETHRGASVARLEPDEVRWLYELRAALELEAAHLALERHGGRLPEDVHAALAALRHACSGAAPAWSEVNEAHTALHGAIVAASGSPRIVSAHAALSGETLLFLLQLQPLLPAAELAADHVALVAGLESEGPAVLRDHLRRAAEALAEAG